MSGTLALSSVIASFDRQALTELVRTRRVSSPSGVDDPLDLAVELLRTDSITQALTELTRGELTALAQLAEGTSLSEVDREAGTRLRSFGLTAETALPEVSAALRALTDARGTSITALAAAAVSARPQPAVEPAAHDPADTSSWFAAALTTTAEAAWMLRQLSRAPAKLNRNGGVASAWQRFIEDALAITRPDELAQLVRAAHLAAAEGAALVARADTWLAADQQTRWTELATAAVRIMPAQVLGLLAGTRAGDSAAPIIAAFPQHYPLTTEATSALVTRTAALWERLGITVGGAFSEAGALALRAAEAGGSTPTRWPDLGLPAPVSGVYIQPDLTIVVPGPLAAADEAALAELATPEQLGVASMLRLTEASLAAAFDRGMSAAQVRELLGGLTVTGIPQPLDYLISSLSERSGSIVVAEHLGTDARTRVTVARPELRSTLLVDRRLAHLQLQEMPPTSLGSAMSTDEPAADAGVLFSRLRPDHVLAALLDARYPAVPENTGIGDAAAPTSLAAPTATTTTVGASRTASRSRHDQAEAPALDPLDALIDRVLNSLTTGPTDISRQVTLAIRDRTPLVVTVEIRGDKRDFRIVPVSLASGRVRALDEAAGVQRTLPLDAITSVSAIPRTG